LQGDQASLNKLLEEAHQQIIQAQASIEALNTANADLKATMDREVIAAVEKGKQFEELAVTAQKELETLGQAFTNERQVKTQLLSDIETYKEAADLAIQLTAQHEALAVEKQQLLEHLEALNSEKAHLAQELANSQAAVLAEQQRVMDMSQIVDETGEEIKRFEADLRASNEKHRLDLEQLEEEHRSQLAQRDAEMEEKQKVAESRLAETVAEYERREAEKQKATESRIAGIATDYERREQEKVKTLEQSFANRIKSFEADTAAKLKLVELEATNKIKSMELATSREMERFKTIESEMMGKFKHLDANAARVKAVEQQTQAKIEGLTTSCATLEQKLAEAEECASHWKGQVEDLEKMFQDQEKKLESASETKTVQVPSFLNQSFQIGLEALRSEYTKVQKQVQESTQKVQKYKVYVQKQQKEFAYEKLLKWPNSII